MTALGLPDGTAGSNAVGSGGLEQETAADGYACPEARFGMAPQLDIGKLVGAASAPVALIIATSIFLSNIGGRHASLGQVFRSLCAEYRDMDDWGSVRARSVKEQIGLYAWRLRALMRATLVLTLSIECFVLTVVFTSVGIIFPGPKVWFWATASFSLAGLLLLAVAVGMELVESKQASRALMLETAEFDGVLADPEQEEDKRELAAGMSSGEGRDGQRPVDVAGTGR